MCTSRRDAGEPRISPIWPYDDLRQPAPLTTLPRHDCPGQPGRPISWDGPVALFVSMKLIRTQGFRIKRYPSGFKVEDVVENRHLRLAELLAMRAEFHRHGPRRKTRTFAGVDGPLFGLPADYWDDLLYLRLDSESEEGDAPRP